MTDIAAQEEVRTSQELGEFAKALAAAQGDYPDIKKNRTAHVKGKTKEGKPYDYTFHYADISDVLTAVRPVLAKHGLAFIQLTSVSGGVIYIKTRLIHESGQWIESEYPVASYQQNHHQKIGEALTYARRYAGCAMLGVAAEEDIDVGGDAATVDSPPQRQQPRPEREAPSVVQGNGEKKELPPAVDDAREKARQIREKLRGATSIDALVEAWEQSTPALDEISKASEKAFQALKDAYAERERELNEEEGLPV